MFRNRSSSKLLRAKDDPRAFVDFYDAYADRVLRFVGSRVLDGEVALDLMSETFAKALERRHQFRGDSQQAEQAWIFSIAANEIRHYWRSGKVEREATLRLGILVPSLTDGELEHIEERAGVQAVADDVKRHLGMLPDEQQQAIRLRVVDDLSYDEIAQQVGVTSQVIRARVSRGLRALAVALSGDGILAEDFS